MATGQLLWDIPARSFHNASSNLPNPDTIVGLESPGVVNRVLSFSGSAAEHADITLQMPTWYSGLGATIKLKYANGGTSTTQLTWEVRIYKISDLDDLDTDLGIDTRTAVTINDTPNGTQGAINYTATQDLAHGDMNSPSAGDQMLIRVTGRGDSDSNSNVRDLVSVWVEET